MKFLKLILGLSLIASAHTARPSAPAATLAGLKSLFETVIGTPQPQTAATQVADPLERQQYKRLKNLLALNNAWAVAPVAWGEHWIKQLIIYAGPVFAAAYLSHKHLNTEPFDDETLEGKAYENRHLIVPTATVAAILLLKNLPFMNSRLQTNTAKVALEALASNWKNFQSQIPARYKPFFASLADQYTRLGGRLEMSESSAAAAVTLINFEINAYFAGQTAAHEFNAVATYLR